MGTSTPMSSIIRFGPFELDAASGELRKGDSLMKLQPQPLRVLLLLTQHAGQVVTREEIQRHLWSDSTFVDFGRGINFSINQIRGALADDAERPRYIETLPRRGYRFIAPITSGSYEERLKRDTDSSREAVGASVLVVSSGPWWRTKAAIWTSALTLLALLTAGSLFYRSNGRHTETIDSVAVLPFVNASGDPNTEYLSDGITESLINNLSQLPHLKVMSRDSAFRYKGKEADAQTVGRALGVRAIFKGRIVQRGDAMDISAELVDARDNSHIWGEQYSRKPSDIFALQGEIAKEITAALRLRLTGQEQERLAKAYTANPEAYQDYLKGRFWWNKRTQDGFNKGIEYFQQAITSDPTYALAYSGLADCYSLLAVYRSLPPKEAYPKAKEAALKALELDQTLAEAHVSLARVKAEYDWDWLGGEREFQRAIELNPNYATAHQWYGDILETMGQPEEAVAEYKRALELDPLSLIINSGLGEAFLYARQYDQAIEQLQKTLELDPYFPGPRFFLSQAYVHKSMYQEGIAEIEKSSLFSAGNSIALSGLGYAYAVAGRKVEAQKVLDQMTKLAKQRYVPATSRAVIYAGLEEKGKAFEWLEKGYEDRTIGLGPADIKVNPAYDPLRSDPRFADVLRRMNLQP